MCSARPLVSTKSPQLQLQKIEGGKEEGEREGGGERGREEGGEGGRKGEREREKERGGRNERKGFIQ